MLLDVMFLLTIIFILLCLLGIVTSYVWAKRQNRIYPKTMEDAENYTFTFRQLLIIKEKNWFRSTAPQV